MLPRLRSGNEIGWLLQIKFKFERIGNGGVSLNFGADL